VLKLQDHHGLIAAEVALRPDVTLNELRAWLLATHGLSASLGLMHQTLARLGLTLKKSRAGRRSRTGPMSPSGASPGGPGKAR
jgi:transposase